jgi:hypothetical protein
MFERFKRVDESFSAHVSSIRDAALVSKLPVSEQEIIDILDGLSPAQRSLFVFGARPSSWADTDRLCVYDRNITVADSTRQRDDTACCAMTPARQLSNRNTGLQAVQVLEF